MSLTAFNFMSLVYKLSVKREIFFFFWVSDLKGELISDINMNSVNWDDQVLRINSKILNEVGLTVLVMDFWSFGKSYCGL